MNRLVILGRVTPFICEGLKKREEEKRKDERGARNTKIKAIEIQVRDYRSLNIEGIRK